MSVLVKSNLEVVSKYDGKGVTTKVGSKKHQVYFKLYCDDSDIEECISLYRRNTNIILLDYQGTLQALKDADLNGIYITKSYTFGNNVNAYDIRSVVSELPENVVGVIKLPEDFSDMKFIIDMCEEYPNIRFTGGIFFAFDEARIGYIGKDILLKNNIKGDEARLIYEGTDCALDTFVDEDVELVEGRVKASKSSGKSSTGGKKKKTLLFNDLLYQNGIVEF